MLNKKLNLPIGIRYIQVITLVQIGLYFALIYPLLSDAFSNINIFMLLIIVFLLFPVILLIMIIVGLNKIKYWAWVLAIVNFGIFAIYNITKFNPKIFITYITNISFLLQSGLIWFLIRLLSLWYLYKRKDLYKIGRLPNEEKLLKEEMVFKYLFWVFAVIIILWVFYYLFGWYLLLRAFH